MKLVSYLCPIWDNVGTCLLGNKHYKEGIKNERKIRINPTKATMPDHFESLSILLLSF